MVSAFPMPTCRQLAALVIVVILPQTAGAQTKSNVAALLNSIHQTYVSAAIYRLEVTVYRDMSGSDSGNWSSSFQSAVVGQPGHYRFEARGPHYSWLQVSDGTSEWFYNAVSHEYLRRSTPADQQPTVLPLSTYFSSSINDAHDLAKDIAGRTGAFLNPEIAESETLKMGGKEVSCTVIRGNIKYRSGWPSNVTAQATWWIETGTARVRQIEERWSGSLVQGDVGTYKRVIRETYPVVEFGGSALSNPITAFVPPGGAREVLKFSDASAAVLPERTSLIGQELPPLSLKTPGVEPQSTRTFRGKPLLLEFWATWCGPCVQALPNLAVLYSEAQKVGVAVVTIDEDENPQEASEFLAKHTHSSWPNYHDNGEMNRAVPGAGLPQFLLVDATGRIVYQDSGFDENELRSAISSLGTEYKAIVSPKK
jgi:thiol-disulfide isomerase/thioredoxin